MSLIDTSSYQENDTAESNTSILRIALTQLLHSLISNASPTLINHESSISSVDFYTHYIDWTKEEFNVLRELCSTADKMKAKSDRYVSKVVLIKELFLSVINDNKHRYKQNLLIRTANHCLTGLKNIAMFPVRKANRLLLSYVK